MQITSFSNLGEPIELDLSELIDVEQYCKYTTISEGEKESPHTERLLYTIMEETELRRPASLTNLKQWDSLESCGSENKLGAASIFQEIMAPTTSVEYEESVRCQRRLFDITATDSDTFDIDITDISPEGELRMIPNITDDEKYVGGIYSTFCSRQRTKHVAVQCDILQNTECHKCTLLVEEISKISQLLQKANAEIDYLNDEFRILNEEKRHDNLGGQYQTLETESTPKRDSQKIEQRTIYCFARCIFMGVWGLPRTVLKRFFLWDN